jgi:glutathione S-transferase
MFANRPPPEMERLGPLGTVPTLETDDGTLIRSSLAILEYLEELSHLRT